MSQSVHKDLVQKLEEVLEIVKPLPQGYQYKVRELCACIETVVSMYDDIQKGIIPEVLINMRNEVQEDQNNIVDIPVVDEVKEIKVKLNVGDITL